jgi:uncharacterized protein
MPSNAFRTVPGLQFPVPVFDYLLLKLASRCNLKCTYCYWFRDKSVYERPKVLLESVEAEFLRKLELHINEHSLGNFSVLFHGGEPTLIGKRRFIRLAEALRAVESATGCRLHLSMTTNGVLIDEDWAAMLRIFDVSATVSIDGPPGIHDLSRVDHAGRGSFTSVRRGVELLRGQDVDVGLLAVCNPSSDPGQLLEFFVKDLEASRFDVLIPDATNDDNPASITNFYTSLFDLWYEKYSETVNIRYLRSMVVGLLGGDAHIESLGFGPIQTCALLTDGALEPLDVLRIAGYEATRTSTNIFDHTFQDVTSDPVWLEAFVAAQTLNSKCLECRYTRTCGGGFLPHRFSRERRFDNPSVYCADLLSILDHISSRLTVDLQIRTEKELVSLSDALV